MHWWRRGPTASQEMEAAAADGLGSAQAAVGDTHRWELQHPCPPQPQLRTLKESFFQSPDNLPNLDSFRDSAKFILDRTGPDQLFSLCAKHQSSLPQKLSPSSLSFILRS